MAEQDNEIRILGEISFAITFNELYEAIKQKREIVGSVLRYKADDLIDQIEDLREVLLKETINPLTKEVLDKFVLKHNYLFEKFTRSQGLRKKVKQLIVLEVIARSKKQ